MEKTKSIRYKLSRSITPPLLVSICTFGVIVLFFFSIQILNAERKTVQLSSESAAFQISDFLTKYLEITNQMACNESILQMMRDIKQPGDSLTVSSYEAAENSLNRILESDDAISLAWTVDFDTGDSVRSSGITRGLTIDEYDVTTRDWYIEAMAAKKLIITEPYIDTLSQTLVTSIITPAYDADGSMLGLVAIDMTLAQIDTTMSQYKLGNNGFFIICTNKGTIMFHPNADLVSQSITEVDVPEVVSTAITSGVEGDYNYFNGINGYHSHLTQIGNTGWIIFSSLPDAEYFSVPVMLAFFILALITLSSILLTKTIKKNAFALIQPLNDLALSANELADGNLDVNITVSSNDEIGLVADALKRTVIRLKEYIDYISEISTTLDKFADGNLNLTLEHSYDGDFNKIKVSLEHFISNLTDVLNQIKETSSQVADGSKQVAEGAQALAEGTLNQNNSVSTLSSSFDNLIVELEIACKDADKASKIADEEETYITRSKEKMNELIVAIQQINEKSDEISSIVQTIDNIASQTNMLSLNAAIEAARAGEAGRGFSVVATEVNSLAQQSTDASHNISALIADTLNAVQKGVKLATESGELQDMVVTKANEANEIMRNISNNTIAHISASKDITDEIGGISFVVQSNSATAEQSSAASQELNSQAEVLKTMVTKFHY